MVLRFYTREEIRVWCGNCQHKEVRVGKKSGKSFYFCGEKQVPCFNAIRDCKEDASPGTQTTLSKEGS